jgi:hypothetical protein
VIRRTHAARVRALEWFLEAERTGAWVAFRADPRNREAFDALAPARRPARNDRSERAWAVYACISVRDWLRGPFPAPMPATIQEARNALGRDA